MVMVMDHIDTKNIFASAPHMFLGMQVPPTGPLLPPPTKAASWLRWASSSPSSWSWSTRWPWLWCVVLWWLWPWWHLSLVLHHFHIELKLMMNECDCHLPILGWHLWSGWKNMPASYWRRADAKITNKEIHRATKMFPFSDFQSFARVRKSIKISIDITIITIHYRHII